MNNGTATIPAIEEKAGTPARPASQRAEIARFFRTSAIFLSGLVLTLFASDGLVGVWLRHQPKDDGILKPIVTANIHDDSVRYIFLGDSVARQLFPPGSEPTPQVRYITTNQALSVAGQCYLAEDALRACPYSTDVYLLYIPGCFSNNLPPPLSREYLCGYFHSPRQVAEIYRIKHDLPLSAAHAGRMLLPNLMLENSARNHAAAPPQPGAPTENAGAGNFVITQPDMGGEPLFALLERWQPAAPPWPATPAGTYGPRLSPVSEYFLARMRTDCRERNVRLHILPCPLSKAELYEDAQHIYEMPPLRVDPALLVDAVHFQRKYVPEYRQKVIEYYHLPIPSGH